MSKINIIPNQLITEKIKSIGWKIIENIIRFSLYISIFFIITSVVFKENISKVFFSIFYSNNYLPDTFKIIIYSTILFLFFTIIVSVIAASREQSHFKTSLVIRLILFIMNVIPIAMFQHILFDKFGFRLLYFIVFYLVFQILIDILIKPLISKIELNNNILIFIFKIMPEIFVVVASIILVNISGINHSADMRNINMHNYFEMFTYFLYIVFFNAITFFTVEYCIDLFRDEYKKNYIKYYFLFNDSYFKKIIFILRSAIPNVLDKIRKNLSWLIMFIITVDTIFQNAGSIGSNLLEGYEYGASIVIKNVIFLLIIMFFINLFIDIVLALFHKDKRNMKEIYEVTNIKQENIAKNKNITLLVVMSILLIFYFILFVNNYKKYPYAAYYDFPVNMEKTVMNVLQDKNIDEDNCPVGEYNSYNKIPLCKENKILSYFSIVKLEVLKDDGSIHHMVPYYDKATKRFYFIENNRNIQYIEGCDINLNDKIISIDTDYKRFNYADTMTEFRLQTDTKLFLSKPLSLILPFYLFYFMTLIIVVFTITKIVYECIIRFNFISQKLKDNFHIPKIITREILFFLNSITLVVVFLITNKYLESSSNIELINMTFSSSFLKFIIIQVLIVVMFSYSYVDEIFLNIKGLLKSKEFEYYSYIGLNSKNQNYIYNHKYGNNLLWKLIFQNLLFVLNINWFISYAFNVWKTIKDYIGVIYNLNFENILTKIIHFETSKTQPYNFLILIILDSIIFILYYYFNKKMNKG